jgi:hypothetical protein
MGAQPLSSATFSGPLDGPSAVDFESLMTFASNVPGLAIRGRMVAITHV